MGKPLLILIAIVFVSGCVSDPLEMEQQETVDAEEAAESLTDPLANHKQTLRTTGIDCSFENTYDTRKSLVIDPTDPDVLYVGVEGKGVFKSTDGGATWKSRSNGILAYPDNSDLMRKCYPDMAGMTIDPQNNKRLLLAMADVSSGYINWSYAETAGIWETLDSGTSWHQIVHGDVNAAGTGALSLDPEDAKIIYYGVNSDPPTFKEAPYKETLNKKGPLYKTVDGGRTWTELNTGMLPGLQATAIFVNPENANELLLMTQSHDHIYHEDYIEEIFTYKQFGPMLSKDGGLTWTALAERLPSPYQNVFEGDVAQSFRHIFVRPFLFGDKFPDDVEQKSFVSVDGGETFEQTPVFLWVARYNPHDPSGNHMIGYSPWYADGDLVESYDGGRTWHPITQPEDVDNTNVRISNIIWDPQDANVVYMSGTAGHVWKRVDGKWQTILNLDRINNLS